MIVLALFLVVAMLVGTVVIGVLVGTAAYAGWRSDKRDMLLREPVARHFYGAYQSPFPWHRVHEKSNRKEAA